MSLSSRLILLAISLGTIFVAGHAHACKLAPEAYDLDAFLSSPKTNKIIFRGHVQSVESTDSVGEQVHMQKIYFQVDRWWQGKVRNKVVALGIIGIDAGTDCEGVFDFNAQLGGEWLIVGYEEKGFIRPSGLLSKLLVNGVLPIEISRSLAY